MKKRILIIIMLAFFLPLVSGALTTLGFFEQGLDAKLKQLCDDCSYNNITSIVYPNGTTIIEDVAMTKRGTEYNYTLISNFTNTRGTYTVNGFGDEGGSDTIWVYTFYINKYGRELTEAEQGMFSLGMILIIIFLIVSIYGIFKIEHYIGKFTCYWIAHILFIALMFSAWQFTDGFAIGYNGLAGVFKVFFWVSITAMLPMLLLSIAWIVWIHTVTEEMRDMMEKGMSPEEAWGRSKDSRGNWFKW